MRDKDIQINSWINFACDDLKAAEISVDKGIANIVCFHSQQSVEKCLKALYLYHFDTIPKTHDLEAIVNKLMEKETKISEHTEQIRYLNKFYIPTRYPDALPGSLPDGLPNAKDANKALENAKIIVEFIKNLLKRNI